MEDEYKNEIEINAARDNDLAPEITDSIAGMIVLPSDIPDEVREKYFPLINKQMSVSNLSREQILDMEDEMEIMSIRALNSGRRGDEGNDPEMLRRVMMYARLELSNSRDGHAVKRITTSHRTVSVDDNKQQKPRGIFKRLMGGE